MILITGDTHGDLSRLKSASFRASHAKKPRKGDTLIICGDFGFLWDGSEKEKAALKKLSKKKYRILFVKGTHENFDLLEGYPLVEFAGGKARKLASNIFCLENGYFFSIDGTDLYACGGGESPDKLIRMDAGSYDHRELPSEEEVFRADNRYFTHPLNDKGLRADIIVTHDAPTKVRNLIDLNNKEMHHLHAHFDRISQEGKFGVWYFGRHHLDRKISSQFYGVFRRVLMAVPRKKRRRAKRNSN